MNRYYVKVKFGDQKRFIFYEKGHWFTDDKRNAHHFSEIEAKLIAARLLESGSIVATRLQKA